MIRPGPLKSQMARHSPEPWFQPHSSCELHEPQSEWRAHAVTHGVAESWMPEVQVQVCDIGTS